MMPAAVPSPAMIAHIRILGRRPGVTGGSPPSGLPQAAQNRTSPAMVALQAAHLRRAASEERQANWLLAQEPAPLGPIDPLT